MANKKGKREITINERKAGRYIKIGMRQYKMKEELPIDYYTKRARSRRKYGKKDEENWKEGGKEYTRYIKELRKKKRLNTQISKGSTSAQVDLSRMNRKDVQAGIYGKLLKPLVLDKEIYKLILHNRNNNRVR